MGQPFVPIPFGSNTYVARSEYVYGERLLNWYPETNPDGRVTLYPTPGLKLWTTVGTGVVRGIIGMGDDLYVVVGNEVYAISPSKMATSTASAPSGTLDTS